LICLLTQQWTHCLGCPCPPFISKGAGITRKVAYFKYVSIDIAIYVLGNMLKPSRVFWKMGCALGGAPWATRVDAVGYSWYQSSSLPKRCFLIFTVHTNSNFKVMISISWNQWDHFFWKNGLMYSLTSYSYRSRGLAYSSDWTQLECGTFFMLLLRCVCRVIQRLGDGVQWSCIILM
jgi:hypothetical protein